MKHSIFTFALFLMFLVGYTQQAPIAIVSSNGTTKLTSTLDSAAILAQDNDIIYLPGGVFAGQTIMHFDKKVTVIGVGHNPDSTSATGRTEITGNIGLQKPGSILDGVYVFGSVYISANCKVYRVNTDIIVCPGSWITAENCTIEKSVIRTGIYGAYGQNNIVNSTIKNCIIAASNFTQQIYGTTYENCVFLTQGGYPIDQASSCTFRNCIFNGITGWGGASSSFFYNNAFVGIGYPPLTDSSNAIGNIVNLTTSNTFVTTPNAPTSTYNYACDYLIHPSNTAVLTGGTGGTQMGIYGGSSPWVKGNIPPNPHIRTKNVDPTTGVGGTLRVRFNVGIQ